MKIKNELVKIEIGSKKYDFNNKILDEYLNRFAKAQLDQNELNSVKLKKALRYCLIKFDTPFQDLQGNTELHNQDFDICFVGGANYTQTISEEQIVVQYDYDTSKDSFIWDYEKNTADGTKISDYYDRKITAIGFNSYWTNDENLEWKLPICAILDTSNYNMYLQKNEDLSITRKDILITDGLFYSNDSTKVPGPAHLAPNGVPQIIEQSNIYNEDKTSWYSFNDSGYGILYSVGLSSYKDYIDKEFVIGNDVQIEDNGNELKINDIENYFSTDNPLFSNKAIYPSTNLYPVKSNYKYVIFKYKVWQLVHSGTFDNVILTTKDTGYFYYQAIPIDKFGKSNFKIKYERE